MAEKDDFLSAAEELRKRLVAIRTAIDIEIGKVDFLIDGSATLSTAHLAALAVKYRDTVAMSVTDRILH
jgi:hypothetical protein